MIRPIPPSVSIGAVFGIVGLYLGRKQPVHAIALSGAGTAIGHMLDTYIEKHIERVCPDCGVVLLFIAHEAESQLLSTP